jgi:BolA protein
MAIVDEMRERLQSLGPSHLEIIDESAQHAGHAGARPGGESHFRILMRAPILLGQSRLARHRAVHAALGPALIARIHALAIEIED